MLEQHDVFQITFSNNSIDHLLTADELNSFSRNLMRIYPVLSKSANTAKPTVENNQ